MEKDEFLKDDVLRKLMNRIPLDSPSDDFVERVMADIQLISPVQYVKKPFFPYLKSVVPYLLIALFLFFVFFTSDLPIFSWVPGKDIFLNNLTAYFGTFFALLKNAFASKFVSWGLLVSGSAGVLFYIDRFFSRRASI